MGKNQGLAILSELQKVSYTKSKRFVLNNVGAVPKRELVNLTILPLLIPGIIVNSAPIVNTVFKLVPLLACSTKRK